MAHHGFMEATGASRSLEKHERLGTLQTLGTPTQVHTFLHPIVTKPPCCLSPTMGRNGWGSYSQHHKNQRRLKTICTSWKSSWHDQILSRRNPSGDAVLPEVWCNEVLDLFTIFLAYFIESRAQRGQLGNPWHQGMATTGPARREQC